MTAPPPDAGHLCLEDLIAILAAHDPDKVLKIGFTNPHFYRGYYEDLAFEVASDVTVGAMLADARSALGKTFQDWKGGDYTMAGYTDVWLAEEGATGESLGRLLLFLLLANEVAP